MIKNCPNCKSEQIITDAGKCSVCGTNVAEANSQTPQEDGDQLDIVVTEVPEDDREFVGGGKSVGPKDKGPKPPPKGKSADQDHLHRALSYDPIGFSEPTLPPNSDTAIEKDKNIGSDSGEKEKPAELKATQSSSGQIKKLTPEEIKAIEKNLYGKNVHLADKEKASIRSKINEIEGRTEAASTPKPKGGKPPLLSETLNPVDPESAGRGRGVAYYYKNYIKLAGQHHLTKHDELILNGRTFSLQPKRLKPTYIYAGLGVVFAIILFLVGSWFVKGSVDGQGQVAGIVLDNSGKPYLKGASIRFPDLGVTVESNAQGLFTTDDIPAGAHRVEYIVDGRVIGSDHATVLDNGISVITLSPSTNKTSSKPKQTFSSNSSKSSSQSSSKQSNYTPPPPPKPEPTPTQKSTSNRNEPGSIELAANVDNARFKLDGKTLGAGNLEYASIKPGNHRWEVSADGYKKKTGTISLDSGQNKKLTVSLSPLSQKAKQASYGADDYFQSGVNSLKSGKYEEAVSDFTSAIKDIPSYPQAYYNRGLAYQVLKKNSEALDDFIRAAEIYKIKKEYNWAITSYGRAIGIDDKSIAALLGRGDLFLAKSEDIAAATDFDAVLNIDKRNYQAYYGLGQARFRQGQYKSAIEHFKDARSINRDDPFVYQYLMLCYMAVNDHDEVKKSFEKFNELASDNQKRELMNDKRFAAAIEVAKR